MGVHSFQRPYSACELSMYHPLGLTVAMQSMKKAKNFKV